MNQQLGAHELLELHEVLTDTIDGINQFELYRPHCQDTELRQILDNQIQFMVNEYNSMVNMMNQSGQIGQRAASYKTVRNTAPTYGMQNPSAEAPNDTIQQMNDHDVSSGMLGRSKTSATMRMRAALECTIPELREMMVQGAKNCADQAYETWTYMNRRGYYQVPTFQQNTMQSIMNQYQPAQGMDNQTM